MHMKPADLKKFREIKARFAELAKLFAGEVKEGKFAPLVAIKDVVQETQWVIDKLEKVVKNADDEEEAEETEALASA